MTLDDPQAPASAPEGVVLYDDACGFCSRWVPFWRPTLARIGLGTLALQDPWVASHVRLDDEALLADLTLAHPDGTIVRGADVYRFAMRRLWWAYPLYLLSITPGGRTLFNWAYRTFARNRYHVSRACGLRPTTRNP